MDDEDETLQRIAAILSDEAVKRILALDDQCHVYRPGIDPPLPTRGEYLKSLPEPARMLPIVEREDLPAEFVDVVKVKIVGWRPVTRRIDGIDVPLLEADWTLVPEDWPGKCEGGIMPVYERDFDDSP